MRRGMCVRAGMCEERDVCEGGPCKWGEVCLLTHIVCYIPNLIGPLHSKQGSEEKTF